MIDKAIIFLKEHGIEAFELTGILTIPVSSPEEIEPMVGKLKGLLNEIGFDKSWAVDPYYYEKHSKIEDEMYGGNKK